jgi:dihydroorotate dehydrogenase (NAD+) catalytic subunit
MASLKTKVGALEFKNPLLAASGTWAYGLELLNHPLQDFLAGFVTKSVSVQPSEGNPMPRLCETDGGLLNSIGLQNMGIDAFLSKAEPKLKAAGQTFVLSIYANKVDDFRILAEKSKSSAAVAIELNISCPNIDKGGLEFSSDPKTTEDLVRRVRAEIRRPLWVKLSPNVTSIVDIAKAAEAGGADALSMINTLVGMAIDIETKKPVLGRKTGGLSGPAIRPVAIERIYRCFKQVKIPIVGMGGIRNARDVIEFLMAGSAAVQIGTWNFRDPFVYETIVKELSEFMDKRGYKTISEIVGLAH